MRLTDPAVPDGWQVQKTQEGATRVTVPEKATGFGIAIGACCMLVTGLFPVAFELSGILALLSMMAGIVALGIGSLWVLKYTTGGQTWILRRNSLEISGATWDGNPQVASYQDCSLEMVLAESARWKLQLHGNHGSVTLHRSHQIQDLLALHAFLEEKSGWQEATREGAPEYFRPVLDIVIRENNAGQLGLLLQDMRALPLLAHAWQEAGAESRTALLQLLTTVERRWGRFSELIDQDGCDAQLLAIEVLEALEEQRALPAFRRLMCEGANPVRIRAALALGRLRDVEAVPALCESLRLEPELWHAAVFALGQIGDHRAIPVLAELLGAPESEKVKGLRQEIVLALAKFGDPLVVSGLADALHDPSFRVRALAAESLGKLGWREAVPALIQTLQDSRWQVASKAATALGALGDPAGVEPLIQALAHENPELRVCAVKALSELGGATALAALCRNSGDSEPRVRREAALAVARLVITANDLPVQARAALPMLQRLYEAGTEESGEVRAACGSAIRKIEAATASVKALPLSVGAPPLEPDALPLPASRSGQRWR